MEFEHRPHIQEMLDEAIIVAKNRNNHIYTPALQWNIATIQEVANYAKEKCVNDNEWLPGTRLWLILNYAMNTRSIHAAIKLKQNDIDDVEEMARMIGIEDMFWRDNIIVVNDQNSVIVEL
jgi:hypothetical protein